jgi:hypothetical protein
MTENHTEPEFETAQLLAYLDGEADPVLAAQIERSPAALKRARELAHWQKRLTARLYRFHCPESDRLQDYHLEFLAPSQVEVIEAHLRICPLCRAELAQLSQFANTAAPQISTRIQETMRNLVARLISNLGSAGGSPQLAPSLAMRGQKEGIQVYEVDDYRIVVEVQPDQNAPDKRRILGLFTGIEATGFAVDVRSGDIQVAEGEIDDLGNFVIPGLPTGEYQITVRCSSVSIQIPAIEVH